MKLIFYYITLIFFFTLSLLGQDNSRKIDSLDILVRSASGKEKVDLLNEQAALMSVNSAKKRIELSKIALELSIIKQSEYLEGISESYNNIGVGFYHLREHDSSLFYLRLAKEKALKTNEPKLLGDIYNNIGNTYERYRNYDTANYFHWNALKIRRAISDSVGIGSSLVNLGLNHWRVGKYIEANEFYLESLEIRKKIGDPFPIGNVLNNIGVLYWNWGRYVKALQYYLEAFEMRENSADSIGTAVTGNNVAILYQKFGDYKKAHQYLTNSLKLATKINYPFGIAYSLENLGSYYFELKDYSKAKEYFLKSFDAYFGMDFLPGIIDINNKIGDVYFVHGDYETARNYYENAKKNATRLGDRKQIVASLNNLGKVYFNLKNYEVSKDLLFTALKLLKEDRMPASESETYGYLSKVFYQQGDLKNAYLYLDRFKTLSDSLYNSDNARIISDFKEKYESEQKLKENELLKHQMIEQDYALRKQNLVILLISVAFFLTLVFSAITYYFYLNKKKSAAEILRAKDEVEKLNKELKESEKNLLEMNNMKDRFFSIIAHDLKNPFHAILAFSEILESDNSELPDQERRKILSSLRASAKDTYHLLENLLLWARTQRDNVKVSLSNIFINELIDQVVNSQNNFLLKKDLKIDFTSVEKILIFSDKYILETVLRNLISNAIKYSHPSTEIKISSGRSQEDMIFISIIDAGIGMRKETIDGLFRIDINNSTPGTDQEHGTGLGLIICNEFLKLINGTLEVESEPGKGSTFTVKLPVE